MVSSLTGLPEPVLQKAALKSIEFEDSYGGRANGLKGDSTSHDSSDEIVFIQKLMRILANTHHCSSADAIRINSLIELKRNAWMLLQEN